MAADDVDVFAVSTILRGGASGSHSIQGVTCVKAGGFSCGSMPYGRCVRAAQSCRKKSALRRPTVRHYGNTTRIVARQRSDRCTQVLNGRLAETRDSRQRGAELRGWTRVVSDLKGQLRPPNDASVFAKKPSYLTVHVHCVRASRAQVANDDEDIVKLRWCVKGSYGYQQLGYSPNPKHLDKELFVH